MGDVMHVFEVSHWMLHERVIIYFICIKQNVFKYTEADFC